MFISVDFPEPEGPIIATKSPRSILSETSRRAGTLNSPMRNVLTRCSISMTLGLLIMQRLDRIHICGFARRVESKGHAHQRREEKRDDDRNGAHHGGPLREVRNKSTNGKPDHNPDGAPGDRQRDGFD